MRFDTQTWIRVPPATAFAELHHYKEHRDAGEFFPLGIVRVDFRVLTDHVLGQGATYDWQFRLFGLPIFHFRERVEAWQEPTLVAYRSLTGWQMYFRTELQPLDGGTQLSTTLEYSLGSRVLDRLFLPLVRWGLPRVYGQMKRRLEAKAGQADQHRTDTATAGGNRVGLH